MKKEGKIYVAGHTGMVGSGVLRALERQGYANVVVCTRAELDLLDRIAVREFFDKERPDYVILAAAKVGGIKANMTRPADFIYQNLAIQNNVIHESYLHGVKKLCFLGSSCIYPRECSQPMKEEYLLTGPLEPTNEAYAVAKIAGLKMVEYYRRQYGFGGISVMPSNLYGTNDSFDLESSHVLSALVRKFVDAVEEGVPTVTVWGTGSAMREFLHVDDAADGIIFLMNNYDEPEFVNLGTGEDISIKDLALLIKDLTGFGGEIVWDKTKPDGMPKKCMDVSKMSTLGFEPAISLREGVKKTIAEYRELRGRAQGMV